MKTSNFANAMHHKLPGVISIARYPDRRSGFKGAEFPALFPPEQLLRAYKDNEIDWDEYSRRYQMLTLRPLDPQRTWDTLLIMAAVQWPADKPGTFEPILICYESAKTLDVNPCHRRLVAAWFEAELGVVVPEWRKA